MLEKDLKGTGHFTSCLGKTDSKRKHFNTSPVRKKYKKKKQRKNPHTAHNYILAAIRSSFPIPFTDIVMANVLVILSTKIRLKWSSLK